MAKGLSIGGDSLSGGFMKLAPLALFVLFGLFLAGCAGIEGVAGGGESAPSDSYRYAMAEAGGVQSAPAAEGAYVTKEGYVSVRVEPGALEAKFEEMKAKLRNQGAELGDIRYSEYAQRKQYALSVKVLPAKFDAALADLKTLGEVKDLSVNLEDVSRQYRDLDTRITNKEIELDRLRSIYNRTSKVSEFLEIERELSRVETELELLKAEKSDLVSRVEKSTVNITLYEEAPATSELTLPLEGLANLFFGAFAAALMLITGAAGFLLPPAILVAVLWFAYKALRGGGKKPREPEHKRIPPPE